MSEWKPIADMERREGMSAWYYQMGIYCSPRDCYPGLETSAFDRDYTLCRKAPWYKQLIGIRYEYKDNPDGNSMHEMIEILRRKR